MRPRGSLSRGLWVEGSGGWRVECEAQGQPEQGPVGGGQWRVELLLCVVQLGWNVCTLGIGAPWV